MKGRLSGAPIVFALGAAGAGAVLVAAIAFGNDAGVDFTTQMTVIVAAFPVVAPAPSSRRGGPCGPSPPRSG